MALRVSKLIVKGVEAATMVCFLAVPAVTFQGVFLILCKRGFG